MTPGEIQAEIERMASRLSLGQDQLLEILEQERGIRTEQYAEDIIWPMLALRKVTAPMLRITEEEIQQAYQAEYGPAVKARMIVLEDRQTADQVRTKAAQEPDRFPELAGIHSVDVNSASAGGLIPPIRRYLGEKEVEDVAFRLRDGEISPVLQVGNQYILLKCDGRLPPRNIALDQVRGRLSEKIRDDKTPQLAKQVFRRLQDQAVVVNVYNDPQRRQQMPGIAATVNGEKITLLELAEKCIERHGVEVLEGTIHRRLIEQVVREKNLAVTKQELQEEVARAAEANGVVLSNGQPDLTKWYALVTEQPGVTRELYLRDAVWPSVALKKLVAGQVEVSDADMQKSYEANFGPRVRCRVIILGNQRQAQRVWDLARKNRTAEHFAELAGKFSLDPSRTQGGIVPPIQKHGGQPVLESAAFQLQPGEISGLVQVGTQFVILFCEGYTEPQPVKMEEVQEILREDLLEKKLRLAMAKEFERLQTQARIENFMTGESQSPEAGQRLSRAVPAKSIVDSSLATR